jgi:hypothetical protein
MPRPKIAVRALSAGDADGAEPVLERLALGGPARENLARAGGLDEQALGDGRAWAAWVEVDGTALIARSDADDPARWELLAPAGSDEADTQLAARRLHGAVGEQADGWDLDR